MVNEYCASVCEIPASVSMEAVHNPVTFRQKKYKEYE